jgi:hypothetical protein
MVARWRSSSFAQMNRLPTNTLENTTVKCMDANRVDYDKDGSPTRGYQQNEVRTQMIEYNATIRCPQCDFEKLETMPADT